LSAFRGHSLCYDVIQQLVRQHEFRLPSLMDEIKEKLILSFQKQETWCQAHH
jgi:hypothetical protein